MPVRLRQEVQILPRARGGDGLSEGILSKAQIQASLIIWLEAVAAQLVRLQAAADDHKRARYDSVFLLEAMAVSYRWLDRAKSEAMVSDEELALTDPYRSVVLDLRNMNIHQDEYVGGAGRNQTRFTTPDSFEHHADSLQVVGGRYVLGGRLDAIACVSAFQQLAERLGQRHFWPGNRAPKM
jgi:hypothetical protein